MASVPQLAREDSRAEIFRCNSPCLLGDEMKTGFDRRKCLQELEGDDWGEAGFDSSLVRTCHRLRRVPLTDFGAEDLRIMIGQQIGLPFLVPLALETLQRDPLTEGDFYPGDLLGAVLALPATFWGVHTAMRDVLRQIVSKTKERLVSLEESDAEFLRQKLEKAP